jgi:hypothetical protein
MRNMVFGAVVLGLALGLSGSAGAQVYDCAIAVGASQNGFITNRYIFDYDADAVSVTVLDGVIQHENGGPIPGKVASETSKKLGFTWSVKMSTTTGESIRMAYRASLIKATKAMQISVVPQGGNYSGGFDARGSCKLAR